MNIFSQVDVSLPIPTQKTNYLVGSNLLDNLDKILKKQEKDYSSFLILADKTAFGLFGKNIYTSLKKLGKPIFASQITSSEQNKDISQVANIVRPYFQTGFNRNACLISIGGGMVSDLGGFIGSILLRGIANIFVPTTLLAQVDASIGGKTGVNFRDGNIMYKNMLGTFTQPDLVISDVDTLATLPQRELKSGLGEMVKYWLGWNNPSIKQLLSASTPGVEVSKLVKTISLCQQIKIEIVRKDPFDVSGLREKLNLGHTIGHAVEGASNGKLSHGEAVSIGLVAAAKLSLVMNLLSESNYEEILISIKRLGLSVQTKNIDKQKVLEALKLDKKGGNFVLIEDIGKLKTGVKVEAKLIEKVLQEIII